MISIEPTQASLGAIVTGVNLARVDATQLALIKQAFLKHAVLAFRHQSLTDEDQLRFARHFGLLQKRFSYSRARERLNSDELVDVSNLDADGQLLKADDPQRQMNQADRQFHTDASFQLVPAIISILCSKELPPTGGNTEFADMRAVHHALSDDDKALCAELVIEHDIFQSRTRIGFTSLRPEVRTLRPPVPQVLVRIHEETGRPSIYLGAHAARVIGWPLAQGRALIDRLNALATEARFIYSHPWCDGDVVMWDNRCTLHRGTEFDDLNYRRVMQRATVMDTRNSVERAMAAGRKLHVVDENTTAEKDSATGILERVQGTG